MRGVERRAGPLLVVLGLLLSSCAVDRTLRIRSTPEGAKVRLDGQAIGNTPLDVPFEHYGTRRVTVSHPGHLTYSRVHSFEAPWYARFPLDLISETVFGFWSDTRRVDVTLEPGLDEIDVPTLRAVIERAGTLRNAGPEGPRPLPEEPVVTKPETSEGSPR